MCKNPLPTPILFRLFTHGQLRFFPPSFLVGHLLICHAYEGVGLSYGGVCAMLPGTGNGRAKGMMKMSVCGTADGYHRSRMGGCVCTGRAERPLRRWKRQSIANVRDE